MMKAKKSGFTLIELLFAVVVLGVMLSLVMTTIIGMLRFYTFATFVRENQQNGRNIMDTMTREIRFGTLIKPTVSTPTDNILCVADEKNKTLVVYQVAGAHLVRSQYAYTNQTLTDQMKNCDGTGGVSEISKNRQVSAKNMTVTGFKLNRTAGAEGTATEKSTGVIITIDYGTGSVNAGGGCDPGDIYCSVLSFTTAVNNRGGGAQ